jgi:hypothetical protein
VRETPRLESELAAISVLLSRPQALAPPDALALWQVFFMIVPVASTTLASVERMFGSLPQSSLGNVIVDEAGQATPQSLAGILLRARRAMVLGDQRQLEPVVVTPAVLESCLAKDLEPKVRAQVSPLFSTAQSMADQHNMLGTYLGSGNSRVWVSLPFLVHRRCADPMFSIANDLAYDGLMIQGGQGSLPPGVLGPSAWFQVEGQVSSRHWVVAQGELCEKLLMTLWADKQAKGEAADFFVISPFRQVRFELARRLGAAFVRLGCSQEMRTDLRRRVGTVHSFQGKEADIVFFVLGCDFSSGGAADWAGEKPNLVNVAVTRARKYIYVIGDANVWHNRGYFSDLEKALPKVEAPWI